MGVEKIPNDDVVIFPQDIVTVTEMGNITEVLYKEKNNSKITIERIEGDKDHYVDLRTGEIKEFKRIENRQQDLNGVRKSLRDLRQLINANVTDPRKCKMLTLTYHENMTDTKKLYTDSKNFNKKLRRRGWKYEYISCAEPQGRGAWHLHIIMIFPTFKTFIDNRELAKIWGHGTVEFQKIDDCDNVGAYLSAYLGDMEINEAYEKGVCSADDGLERKFGRDGKRYIKGARLKLYPPKFNIFRPSRGVKRPTKTKMRYDEAIKKVSGDHLTYQKSIKFADETCSNTLSYKYYNKKNKKSQEKDLT